MRIFDGKTICIFDEKRMYRMYKTCIPGKRLIITNPGKTTRIFDEKKTCVLDGKMMRRPAGKTMRRSDGKTMSRSDGEVMRRSDGKTMRRSDGKTMHRTNEKIPSPPTKKTCSIYQFQKQILAYSFH